MLRDLPPFVSHDLVARITAVNVQRHAVVARQGCAGDAFFIVHSGELRGFKDTQAGIRVRAQLSSAATATRRASLGSSKAATPTAAESVTDSGMQLLSKADTALLEDPETSVEQLSIVYARKYGELVGSYVKQDCFGQEALSGGHTVRGQVHVSMGVCALIAPATRQAHAHP